MTAPILFVIPTFNRGPDLPRTIGAIAALFVVCRVLHGVFYVGNKSSLRSLVWFVGLACVVSLLAMAVTHIA